MSLYSDIPRPELRADSFLGVLGKDSSS